MGFLSRLFDSSGAVVDVVEAQRRHQEGAMLIDVRESREWKDGHAPGAVHIPLGALGARIGELPEDRDILLICHSGGRSSAAQRTLLGRGYARALNVSGGMSAWQRSRLPMER